MGGDDRSGGRDWRDRGRGRGRGRGWGRGRGRGGGGGGRGGWRNNPKWDGERTEGRPHREQSDRHQTESSSSSRGSDFQKKSKAFSYSNMIPESELGITEHIYKEKKIVGLLKERYSDFIVHEIDPDGNVVKLTSLEVPQEDEVNYLDGEKDSILSEDKWKDLSKLLEKPSEGENIVKEVKIDVTEIDKDLRRKTHDAIRKVFGRKIQTNTLDEDGKKIIVAKKWTGSDTRGNWTRTKDQSYLHFVVHKQDMDTSETVNLISDRFRFKPSNLNFAGTKDRRACTSQKMSLWHGEPKRFKSLNLRNVWIGNYEFKAETMKLGQLKGNLFTIALRNISNTDDEVNQNMTSLKENGFINYFGTQRFGTNKNAPTHSVGRALLQANWEKAVNLILHPRENRGGIEKALECWHKEKDAKKALSLIRGSWSSVEATLLRGLDDAGKNDYLNAFNRLPRNLRLLYLHAYQSFIWNRVASRRIQKFGLKTLPGDLVLIGDDSTDEPPANTQADIEMTDEILEPENVEDKKPDTKSSEQEESAKVRVLSADEAEKTPITQIVLPTPGFKIILPDNELKEWYSEMLAEDGLTLETLRMKSKEHSVGGSYRNFITKPSQLEWKILRYKEADSPLLRTDVEELQEKPEPQDDPDGTLRALVVKMGLDPSTYATIALREVVDYVGALQKKEEEEAVLRKKEEEEAALRKKEEEEAALRKKEEEAAAVLRKKKEQQEAVRKMEEEAARRKKEEIAALRKKVEAAVLKKKEEAALRKKEEEEEKTVSEVPVTVKKESKDVPNNDEVTEKETTKVDMDVDATDSPAGNALKEGTVAAVDGGQNTLKRVAENEEELPAKKPKVESELNVEPTTNVET